MSDARHCADRSGALLLFLFGELADPERAELQGHLGDCTGCRSRLQALRETVDAYRSAGLERPSDPDAWRQRLAGSPEDRVHRGDGRAQDRAIEPVPTRPFPGASTAARWAAGSLLVVGLATVGAWWLGSAATAPGHDPAGPPVSAADVQPLDRPPVELSTGVLRSPEATVGDRFGTAVHVGGDWLAVGAPGQHRSGALYLATLENRTLRWQSRLDPPAGLERDFGATIAGDEDRLAVSGRDRVGSWRVATLRRDRAGWRLEGILEDPAGDPASLFGTSLAMDDDLLLVGASRALPAGAAATGSRAGEVEPVGVVYVYGRGDGGWEYRGRIAPHRGLPNSRFGYSVALDRGRALIGARGEDFSGPMAQPGLAYLFRHDRSGEWSRVRTFRGASGEVDFFGSSVALAGDVAAIGAEEEPEGNARTGAIYVFRGPDAGWPLQARLLPMSPEEIDPGRRNPGLGRGVLLASGRVLGVTRGTAAVEPTDGLGVYVYRPEGDEWELTEVLQPTTVGGGGRPTGTLAVIDDVVLLGLTGGPDSPGSVRVWTMGTSDPPAR